MKIVCVILCLPFLGFCFTGYGRICSPCLLTQIIHELTPGHDEGDSCCENGGCVPVGHHGCDEEHGPVDIHCCVSSLALLCIDAEPAEGNGSLKKKASSVFETGADPFPATGEQTGPPGRSLLLQRQGSSSPPAAGIPTFILHSQLLI